MFFVGRGLKFCFPFCNKQVHGNYYVLHLRYIAYKMIGVFRSVFGFEVLQEVIILLCLFLLVIRVVPVSRVILVV